LYALRIYNQAIYHVHYKAIKHRNIYDPLTLTQRLIGTRLHCKGQFILTCNSYKISNPHNIISKETILPVWWSDRGESI